ncbi:MAG: hypothetical protein R6T99_06345 [Bacteroidales bacterium]
MISINNNSESNASGFLFFLYKWRKPLIIVIILSVAASWFFSGPLFIDPKYRSKVILFPVSTNSISKVLISQSTGIKDDILGFGEEEQAEQLLQLLNSNKIRDRVIQKFNLIDHYGIDTTSQHKMTKLIREYENNVTFRRTEYMAVEISVLDKNPVLAAKIANHISDILDSTKNQIQKNRARKAMEIVAGEYEEVQNEIRWIIDSMRIIGKHGVHDYETQSEALNEQLAIAVATNNKRAIRDLEQRLDVLAEYGSRSLSLKNLLEYKTEQLALLKGKYKEARVDAEQMLPQKFEINHAFVADKKAYPVRWIIVVLSAMSSLLLTVLVIIIIENFSSYRKQPRRDTPGKSNGSS